MSPPDTAHVTMGTRGQPAACGASSSAGTIETREAAWWGRRWQNHSTSRRGLHRERERESKGRASSIDAAEPFANCWSLDEGEGVKRKTTGDKGMPQGQDTGRESPYYATKDRFPLGCSCDREGVGDSGRYVKLLVLLHALLKYQWST